jgi:hypothetical protein
LDARQGGRAGWCIIVATCRVATCICMISYTVVELKFPFRCLFFV